MKVYTKIIIDLETLQVIYRENYDYKGPIMLCKGPTVEQNAIANNMASTYNSLINAFNVTFGGQQAILSSLTNAAKGIVAAGPNQYGFSPAEEAVLTTQAIGQTAATFTESQRALNQQLAARGGGNVFLPSGAEAQLQAQGYRAAAETESALLNKIKMAGYEQGRQNWLTGLGVLGNVAAMEAPTGFAGAATSAGEQAFGAATQIAKEKAAASPLAVAAGIYGLGGSLVGQSLESIVKPQEQSFQMPTEDLTQFGAQPSLYQPSSGELNQFQPLGSLDKLAPMAEDSIFY
jgi:hypothetical protein